MDVLAALRGSGQIGLAAAILAGPLLVWRRCVLVAAVWRGRGGARGRADPTVLAGCLTGAALCGQALPEGSLDFAALLGVGGFWDRPVAALPGLLRDLAAAAPDRVAAAWAADARGDLRLLLAMAAAPLLVRLTIAARTLSGGRLARRLLAETMVFAVSVGGVAWTLPLLCWGVNRLNVWLILAAIVVIQDVRYGRPAVTPRLAARLWSSSPGR